MSYDVHIGSFEGNYTYNVSALFYDHIPAERSRGGLNELDGLTGRQAVTVLSEAFSRIHATKLSTWKTEAVGEPEFCAKYDPPSGWGSTVGALIFLAQILAACAENPRCKVRVS
jgi:hypothetical protein